MKTFKNIPFELLIKIGTLLSPNDVLHLEVATSLADLSLEERDRLWKLFIKPECRTTNLGAAKALFRHDPTARLSHIGYDDKGKKYIDGLIADTLKIVTLTEIQQRHLSAPLTKKQLYAGQITIDMALDRSSAIQTEGLNDYQKGGIRGGLSRDQVNHDWFSEGHSFASNQARISHNKIACAYEAFQGLTNAQAFGVAVGLTRHQVNHSWFTMTHVNTAISGRPYEDYQGLTNTDQVEALGYDQSLTREQVNQPWFSAPHLEAAKLQIPYIYYRGLTDPQQIQTIINRVQDRRQERYQERPNGAMGPSASTGYRFMLAMTSFAAVFTNTSTVLASIVLTDISNLTRCIALQRNNRS